MSTTVEFYSIKSITNLHMGSGENNYGVVDNLVQRDVNTNLPTIHSSSLKGAIKEFFKKSNPGIVETVFGNKDNSGKWQFLSADLLSRPLRSDKTPYFNATSPNQIKLVLKKIEDLGLTAPVELTKLSEITVQKSHPIVFSDIYNSAIIEEMNWIAQSQTASAQMNWINKVFGENLVLVNDDDFQELELPIIARNYLEDGESKNLWYEEVVPYDSRFGFFLIRTEDCFAEFEEGLKSTIQIGANASIGYGLTRIQKQL